MTEAVTINNQELAILCDIVGGWSVKGAENLDADKRRALDRLIAFAEAGADCLYAPGVSQPEEIAVIVKAVSPKPVNVLVSKFNCDLSVSRLADLGVRRISVGSALANVAWGAFMNAARNIKDTGAFAGLASAAPFAELNELFEGRK